MASPPCGRASERARAGGGPDGRCVERDGRPASERGGSIASTRPAGPECLEASEPQALPGVRTYRGSRSPSGVGAERLRLRRHHPLSSERGVRPARVEGVPPA
eukprot:1834814-Pleurochrysis_carterae.AAC.1